MGYTALVYVHGIGEQQRYFELARLVERLERYAEAHEAGPGGRGTIGSVALELEPDRIREGTSRSFLRIRRGPREEVRTYEAYWAPFTAGGRSALQVVRWILRQWRAPLRGLRGLLCEKRWDLHRRHRIAMLYECVSRRRNRRGRFPERLVSRLLGAYDSFAADTARDPGSASPEAFVERLRGDRRLAPVAEAWVRYAIRREFAILAILTTIVLAIALLLLAAAGLLLLLLAGSVGRLFDLLPPEARDLLGSLGYEPGAFGLMQAAQTVVFGFGALGGGWFLSRYLGDVKVWTTYQETEQDYRVRGGILDDVRDLFRHVLADGQCDRIVVVGHSLGTSIAFEALLALRRHERAHGSRLRLERFDHFVTLGCPIDKIHYFFTYDVRTAHLFERMLEEFRGDLDDPPFALPDPAGCRCGTTRPHLHWINIFDPSDIISGSVQSPASSRCAAHRVDNLQLRLMTFPAPGASHLAYFDDRRVLQILYGATFDAEYAFTRAPQSVGAAPRTEAMFLAGESEDCPLPGIVHGLALALPWLTLVSWLMHRLGLSPAAVHHSVILVAAVILLVMGVLAWWARPRHPIAEAVGEAERFRWLRAGRFAR